jgi:LysM repeat protein
MIPGIPVKIVLIDNTTGQQLTVPVLPTDGELAYQDGEKKTVALDILDLGDVEIPTGVALDNVGWRSFFPARYDESYVTESEGRLKKPLEYRNRFSAWKDAGTNLQLVCTAAGLNKSVFIKSFTWALRGAEGDIYYSLQLTEYKKIRPKKVTPGGQPVIGPTAEDRPAAPAAPGTATYTVKTGDTLTLIGKKVKQPWKTIYENNKKAIGPNPNLIKPGQVLTL